MSETISRRRRNNNFAAKMIPHGNAAKMREALSDACYAMHNFLKTKYGGYEEMAKALDKAKATLSNPPRNCDLYETEADAWVAFCKSPEAKVPPEYKSEEYEEWLFAPA